MAHVPMKSPQLWTLAHDFARQLESIKKKNSLDGGRSWYPWPSLAAMQFLSDFLGGSAGGLLQMMGGARVLDVGCGDGDVAYFMESLGAQVDAVDYPLTNYNWMLGVRKLKELLQSNVAIHAIDLDSRPLLPGPSYGLAIVLGILYHLKNPFLALETLARHSRYIFLSTRIASMTPDHKLSFASLPLAYLVDEDELNRDATNYWIFSEEALKRVLRRSSWNILHYAAVGGKSASAADPVTPEGDVRAYVLAESRSPAIQREFHLTSGWYDLEHNAWRWTHRRFSVELDLSSALAPAKLRFTFHLPEEAVARRPRTTVRATVNGASLPPLPYSTPGEHQYAGTLPSLAAGRVCVDFELDGTIAMAEGDERELGVLVDFSLDRPPLEFS